MNRLSVNDVPPEGVETPMHELTIAGERVMLMTERALYLPAHDALLVADLHLGKAAAFRAAHIPVPTGTTAADLARLSRILTRTNARTLIVLGDLLHAKAGRQPGTLATIAAWRAEHSSLQIRLVRGNHDERAGDPPTELDIACVDAPLMIGPFACAHHPIPCDAGYVLAGHLHPHVSLGGRGSSTVRLPCFVFGDCVGILPAFAEFTGTGAYVVSPSDALYAIADDAVVPVRVGR